MRYRILLFQICLLLINCSENEIQPSLNSVSNNKAIGFWERTEYGFYNTVSFKNDSIVTFDLTFDNHRKFKYRIANDSLYLLNTDGKENRFFISKFTVDTLIIDNLFGFESKFVYKKFIQKPIILGDGKEDAKNDINNDSLKVKTYGLPASWFNEYQKIFRDEYNVFITPVAGCIINKELREYVADYNDVSKHRIKNLYGEDIFDLVRKKAQESPNSIYEEEYLDTSIVNKFMEYKK